jgi:hypothetical protein
MRRDIKLELGERLARGYQFHISSSREKAMREAGQIETRYQPQPTMPFCRDRAAFPNQAAAGIFPRRMRLPRLKRAKGEAVGPHWPASCDAVTSRICGPCA